MPASPGATLKWFDPIGILASMVLSGTLTRRPTLVICVAPLVLTAGLLLTTDATDP
ncbi:MAG TPA: hypothetical protein VLC51_04025 [Nitrospira sp.]|nr:hypothetical protein [Nitrospira sp.]